MHRFNRRSLLRGSASLAAGGALGAAFIPNAAAHTAGGWWVQGFIREEDEAFKRAVAEYEKASGNVIDLSLVPFGPLMQKMVSAITSGDVPDVMNHNTAFATFVPQNAWYDKLEDVTEVVETQKDHYHPTALLSARYYNNVKKQRSYYYV